MEILNLEIITPEKVIYSGDIFSVEIPGASGRFTILKQHAPIVAALKNGKINVVNEHRKNYDFDCHSGIIECKDNKVTILIES
ncbi:MAG: ATP synthase F1 subunit epsilon [Marinilabiliaceae bacterium]|nr:ATP synthase F1 subunit epsilon [Marinilabiliaceae bacterium]